MSALATFSSNGNTCEDCARTVAAILSGQARNDKDWMTVTSQYATLSFTTDHHGGDTRRLHHSVKAGCQLCNLIEQKLNDDSEQASGVDYFIFVWQKNPFKAQIQVVHGQADKYIRHISEWKNPPSIALFGRCSDQPLTTHGTVQRFQVVKRPFLPLLPRPHHDSPQAMRLIKSWLDECKLKHEECLRPASSLPRRILRLDGSGDEIKISLYISKREIAEYTILSYSWGESDRIVSEEHPKYIPDGAVTMNGTYVIEQRSRDSPEDQRLIRFWDPADIPLRAFPETSKHAIIIARSLGYHYFWLDSLCIVQDNTIDWADNVAELTAIYSGAAFVISASSAVDSMKGILNAIPDDKPKIGAWSGVDNLIDIFAGSPMNVLDLEQTFIASRAWVFQERLVSVASLHYTDQGLIWECVHGSKTAHDQSLSCAPWKAQWRELLRKRLESASGKLSSHSKSPNSIWYDWISAYSARTFYDARDKFPAIAGVAKDFANAYDLTYIAGLWKEDFLSGLAWRRHNRTPTLTRYHKHYIAPSWSWGSVQGRLEHRNVHLIDSLDERKGPMLKILEDNVSEEQTLSDGTRSFERLNAGATITVHGLLQPVVVDIHRQPGVRKRPFQESGVSCGFISNDNVICTLDEFNTLVPFEEIPRFFKCWCLRIASYKVGLREGDVFLLLNKDDDTGQYHRVGFAETDPYHSVKEATSHSGVFTSARDPVTIVLR